MFDQISDAGLGPIPQGTPPAGALVAYSQETFQTQVLDLTVPNLGIEIAPAKPGHVPVVNFLNWIITQAAGTQTTPLSFQSGSDAAHTNFAPSQATHPSNAEVATAIGLAAGQAIVCASSSIPGFPQKVIPNAPLILDITAGAQGTGGFSLKGFFMINILWMAVSQ